MYPSDPFTGASMDGGRIVDSCATNVRGRLWSRVHSCRNGFCGRTRLSGGHNRENPLHAALAEASVSSNAISLGESMFSVGEEESILPKLKERYDVVFLDGDWREYPRYLPHLRRLTHPGSIIVTAKSQPALRRLGRKVARKAGDPILPDTACERSALPHIRGSWRMAFNQCARVVPSIAG